MVVVVVVVVVVDLLRKFAEIKLEITEKINQ